MPLRLFALSFAMASFVALAACSPREPDIVKLGVLAPRTGTYALRGNDLVNGALLAVEELNASKYKVHGQATKFELLTYDDRGEVEKSLEGAQTFLDRKVVAIIGPLNTPQAEVVVPVIAAAGTPNFITATAADLTGLGGGSAFRLLANDDLQGRAMAILCRDRLKASRIAVVVEKSAYGRGLSEAFSRSLQKDGATSIELAIDVEPTEKVSASMASKIAAAKVDTVVLFASQ